MILIRQLPRLFALAMLVTASVGMAWAQEGPRIVEGQPFANRVRLADTEILLNGTGVRAVAWF